LSFGQCSVAILREIHALGLQPALFPIGNIDLSAQKVSKEFEFWLNTCLGKALSTHKRSTPIIKLWHLNGSLESFSDRQILLSFYELNNPTKEEINIVRQNDKVFFTANYTLNIFKEVGCNNVEYTPLGFDKHNFNILNKQYHTDGRIVFNLCSKTEVRKNQLKVLSAWAKKYGNNPKYYLKCAIFNPFLDVEHQKQLWAQALNGVKYFNIDFLGFLPTNELYNDYLNSGQIVIGMSSCECWALPEFQSVALGKHAVILNATGHKEWADASNSVLVQPNGRTEIYDGVFFKKGAPFNQGSGFTYDDEDFLKACDEAIERVKKEPFNFEGVKLQSKFSYKDTVEKLLGAI
jgi:hypothetical protein